MSNRSPRRARHWAQHRQAGRRLRCPASPRCARATSLLEHQRERLYQGGQSVDGEPADQQRRRDVVGQVGDDPRRRPPASAAQSTASASASIDGRGGRDSAPRYPPRRGSARRSRSIAMTWLAPSARSARVRPPGPGPTSTTVTPSSGAGGARDAPRQVEVEQEILAERPCRPRGRGAAITSRSGGSAIAAQVGHARRLRAIWRGEPQGRAIRLVGLALPGAGDVEAPCRGRARCGRRAGRA